MKGTTESLLFFTGYNESSKKSIFSLILDCEIVLNNHQQQHKIHIQSHFAPTGVWRQVNFDDAFSEIPTARHSTCWWGA